MAFIIVSCFLTTCKMCVKAKQVKKGCVFSWHQDVFFGVSRLPESFFCLFRDLLLSGSTRRVFLPLFFASLLLFFLPLFTSPPVCVCFVPFTHKRRKGRRKKHKRGGRGERGKTEGGKWEREGEPPPLHLSPPLFFFFSPPSFASLSPSFLCFASFLLLPPALSFAFPLPLRCLNLYANAHDRDCSH